MKQTTRDEQRLRYLAYVYMLVAGSTFYTVKHSDMSHYAGLSQESSDEAFQYWKSQGALVVHPGKVPGLAPEDAIVYITKAGIRTYQRLAGPQGVTKFWNAFSLE